MKKIMLFALAMFAAATLQAQNSVEHETAEFEAVHIGIPAEVYITKGRNHQVIIEGDQDDMEDIETSVNNGKLKINREGSDLWFGSLFNEAVRVYITTPKLSGITLAGSGKVVTEDKFKADTFEADINGSGKLDIKIDVDRIDIDIRGSGEIILTGNSKQADINISGSGDVEASQFTIKEAEIDIMGSGNCRLTVTDRLNSKIMGSGDIYYTGDPKHVNNNSLGSGNLKKM